MNIEAAHQWEATDFVILQLSGVDVASCPLSLRRFLSCLVIRWLCSLSHALVSVHKVWFVVLTSSSDLMLNAFGKCSLSFATHRYACVLFLVFIILLILSLYNEFCIHSFLLISFWCIILVFEIFEVACFSSPSSKFRFRCCLLIQSYALVNKLQICTL